MDERRTFSRAGDPSRADAAPEPERPEPEQSGPGQSGPGRQRWPIRVFAGLILLAAVLLLWPFADWSWWPIVIGLGVLVLVSLLRLDRVLFGWAPHLAGLVVVVLMAARSDPWAWGLAAGLAVLVAGFTRLPDWRVLAAGAAVTLVCGVGYGVAHYRTTAQLRADQAAADTRYRQSRSALPAEAVLPSITTDIAADDAVKACGILGSPAGQQFAAAFGAPDCASAVHQLNARVVNPRGYANPRLPAGSVVKRSDHTATVLGCRAWPDPAAAPGPPLGQFELRLYQGSTYLITGYRSCG
ncbi:MAG TPA: hypothetical protein VGM60_02080 [Pseudonocardia sp.]|uniref:hypothetical protein n=1 Tax=Pseudonocardia sp. TaxID=60912 RepID=UPI002F42FE21